MSHLISRGSLSLSDADNQPTAAECDAFNEAMKALSFGKITKSQIEFHAHTGAWKLWVWRELSCGVMDAGSFPSEQAAVAALSQSLSEA